MQSPGHRLFCQAVPVFPSPEWEMQPVAPSSQVRFMARLFRPGFRRLATSVELRLP